MHEGMIVELAGDVFDTLGQCALICKEQAIGAADVVDLLTAEAATLPPSGTFASRGGPATLKASSAGSS